MTTPPNPASTRLLAQLVQALPIAYVLATLVKDLRVEYYKTLGLIDVMDKLGLIDPAAATALTHFRSLDRPNSGGYLPTGPLPVSKNGRREADFRSSVAIAVGTIAIELAARTLHDPAAEATAA